MQKKAPLLSYITQLHLNLFHWLPNLMNIPPLNVPNCRNANQQCTCQDLCVSPVDVCVLEPIHEAFGGVLWLFGLSLSSFLHLLLGVSLSAGCC